MIPRMTTVGTLKNYRYDLNRSNNTLAKAMQTVTTRRNFNSYAEDPALAVRCFQIRRSQHRAESQLTVNDSLRHKFDVGWSALESVSTDLYSKADDTSITSILRSASDTTGPGRLALGQSLAAKAQDIAQIMNGRYGEDYVFAGADTLNPPFTWGPQANPDYIAEPDPTNPDHASAFQYVTRAGDLTNVADDAADVGKENPNYDPDFEGNNVQNPTADQMADPKYGKYLRPDGTGTNFEANAEQVKKENPDYNPNTAGKYRTPQGEPTNDEAQAAQGLYYRGVAVDSNSDPNVAKMEYFLKGESKYIDVGLGHKELDGAAVGSTVFDSALQGIYYLGGYGTKTVTLEDGTEVENVPNNVVSIVNELGQILQRCDADSGDWASVEDKERFDALFQIFEDSSGAFRERWTEMDTQSGFLRDNSELLEKTSDSLTEQYTELEEADPAAAISEFMFAKYCYDAALKVGNSVLSQSLMDYMSF